MPHVHAKVGAIVQLDNGVTVDQWSSINVDVTLPLAAAALAAGNIIESDAVAAPQPPAGAGFGAPVGLFAGPVTDASFSSTPPVGAHALGDGGTNLYFKTAAGPSVWKKVAIA